MTDAETAPARFRAGAFAIIFDRVGQVLLCHRRDLDLWNLPGGGMEHGESPWEAVVREVQEEVGLIVEVERLAGVYAKPGQSEIVFSFICRAVGGELSGSSEADDVRFFAVDRLPRNTSPKQVERLFDALHSGDSTVLKIQRGASSRELLVSGEWPN